MIQLVLLCEGFGDRAFWSGCLRHLNWNSAAGTAAIDKWGRPVRGSGRFLFERGERKVIVHPVHGREETRPALKDYLAGQVYRPDGILINVDSDAMDTEDSPGRLLLDGLKADFDGSVPLVGVLWETESTESRPGVPSKQTLERLICLAIANVHPDRAPSVDRWLDDKPRGGSDGKSHSFLPRQVVGRSWCRRLLSCPMA